ncbi:MAG: hypothetical protein WCH11_00940 [Bdellovibrio sp.]
MSCPKCGFSQPQDQFCAQCGVDVIAFRYRLAKLEKSGARNPKIYLYAGIILGIVGLAIFQNPLRHFREDRNEAQPTFFSRSQSSAESEVAWREEPGNSINLSSEKASETLGAEAPRAASAAFASSSGGPSSSDGSANQMEFASRQAPAPNAASSNQALRGEAVVHFLEMDLQQFEILRPELSASGQFVDFGDFRAAAILDAGQFLRAHAAFGRTPGQIYQKGKSDLKWLAGDSFQLFVRLDPALMGNLKAELKINRIFRESSELRPLPTSNFELSIGAGVLILIQLRSFLSPQDLQTGAKQGPLAILNFPRFRSRQTDLAFFFEFLSEGPSTNAP